MQLHPAKCSSCPKGFIYLARFLFEKAPHGLAKEANFGERLLVVVGAQIVDEDGRVVFLDEISPTVP